MEAASLYCSILMFHHVQLFGRFNTKKTSCVSMRAFLQTGAAGRKTHRLVQLRIVKRNQCCSRNNNKGAIVGQWGF